MRPIGVTDGLQVNIPVLGMYRYELGRDTFCYSGRLNDLTFKQQVSSDM